MSRYSDADRLVARARILARYNEEIDVLEATRKLNPRADW